MKKGFLTLMVALLTLVGMVGYGAVPELLGVPDVIIGDAEDVTPDWFVFEDAFDFDDYVSIYSTGTFSGLLMLYNDASVDDVIRINNYLNTDTTDVYAVSNLASFRNMLCSPYGGGNTAHPVGTSTPVIVYLKAANSANPVAGKTGSFTVYTVDGANDGFSGEYERTELTSADLSSLPSPPWYLADYTPLPVEPGLGWGMRPCDGVYSTTDGAYALETTGLDNDFGYWSMLNAAADVPTQVNAGYLVDYVDGAAYIVTANVYAVPSVTTSVIDPNPPEEDFVPWIRLRMNSANETVSQEMDILSTANGTCEVTTDPAVATTEVMVFDPLDQSDSASGLTDLDALYFSFDLIDFSAEDRTYSGERDEEGLVGITMLDIDTFPMDSVPPKATKVMTYPAAASLEDEASGYTSASYAFGGAKVVPDYDASGDMALGATVNVVRGFGWFQLTSDAMAVTPATGKYYMYKYYVSFSPGPGTDVNDPTWLRLRVYYGDNQRSVNYGVRPTGDWNGYQFTVGVYNVFMAAKEGETTKLYFAFDYLDFVEADDHGACTAILEKVVVFSMDPPPPA